MSQTTLLEEVVQWSKDTCRLEVKSVLPKLIISFHGSQFWEEHIHVLKIITDMFLPHLSLSELEDECFSKVLPKVGNMFNKLMEEINNQVGGLSIQNTEIHSFLRNILQVMVQVLEVLSGCVRHVCSFEEAPALDSIRSLPSCILKVLRNTFQFHHGHLGEVYCGRLSLVGDLLQGLFKEAYSLQKGLMELMDRISLENTASEDDVADVITVIHSLLDICSVISNLDIALHANTWKFIIKQCVKYGSLVEERLRHGDITSCLCDDLLASFHSCLELAEQISQAGPQVAHSPEYKLFQKTTKMCRFFANTLVHYIKEFKAFLSKSCRRFHQLYLQIVSKFPPSLCSPVLPSPLSEELNGAALVPMDALLSQLLPLRPFAESVLNPSQQLSPETELPHCLLLVSVMGQFPSHPEEALQLWCDGSHFPEDTPRLPLFRALFQSFRRCCTERRVPVLLPGVMMKGQAQGNVTLHHHVCVMLCARVASLPPEHFPLLERSLLEAVLQPDTQTALLATDVWCFIVNEINGHLPTFPFFHPLLTQVKSCGGECYQLSHLSLLLRRMVFLMTPGHQMELVERFPPSQDDNLPVWCHILLRALSHDARQRVEADIITLTNTTVTNWQKAGCKLGQLDKNIALLSLLMVVRGVSPEAECGSSALTIISQLWVAMCPSQVKIHPSIQCTLKLLLSMSAILVKSFDPQLICQALVCVGAMVSEKCPDDLLLAALDFLASLGKVFIPHDSQSQVLPRLSDLFGTLLAERSWLINQHALEAFAHFAEVTNHEEVISQSLSSEDTKNKVVNFLSKTINAQETVESRLERLRLETSVLERHNTILEANEETPCPKRARQETSVEEEYRRYLQTAESALRALQTLVEGRASSTPVPPPHWVTSRLQELQTLITHISTANPPNR
uniref:Fignl1 interacting regulator of recombination and mitosis n=1 Tax=Hucho hucho TaxID=62062 RepID=A0A4W5JST4_9TELE